MTATLATATGTAIRQVEVGAYRIATDAPESDGTIAWDAALAADRPVVIEALTDPEVASLPPHITFDAARALTSALLKRDPESRNIIRRSFREKVQEFLPHRG